MMSQEGTMGEALKRQRSCRRKPLAIACWLVANDEVACYQTVDISDTGICITTATPLPVGRIVELQLFLPVSATPLSVTAEVIWSDTSGEGNMGLQFLERGEKVLTALRELTHRCCQKP
jgi:hypothetical protein